ncbi:OprO/OprP family phosphate-selective porin [Zobellia uliginosa]|uniref:OprO/OprP family phosphate-selective porin n=1 Tax=Zobellia uliginosa TaxID=143224 RepID=UPI001C07D0F9|nr:OprO/OprP family phosphate-selective porin [Zobellia uliginosa]MBU2948042.1 OprO/OprP family phosphate-selective porin [Zobellia uliginosa]
MTKLFSKPILTFICILLSIGQGIAQTNDTTALDTKKLKYFLNEEKTHWLAVHMYTQLWMRMNDNNPGSTIAEELEDSTYDVSVRRFRLGFQAQISDRLWVYSQFGINNLNYQSPRGTSLDLLDAYAEFSVSKSLVIGAGKTAWTGLSRYSAPNTSKLLTNDLLLLALPTDDKADDLIRKLSVFAKGKLGRLDYRFVASKPFLPSKSSDFEEETTENIAEFNDKMKSGIYSTYLKWEFWDSESNQIPFSNGTYLSKKRIFSVGVGAEYQNDALSSRKNSTEVFHDMVLWSADAFLDLPIDTTNETALTAYLGYFNYDFGPNYIRNTATNNTTLSLDNSLASFNGPGNAFPSIGTGSSVYLQAGYLFPKMRRIKDYGRLQPYAAVQYSNFERLEDPMIYYDLGINWFLKAHLSKFSLSLQNRPIYNATAQGLEVDSRKWSAVLQYIIRIE